MEKRCHSCGTLTSWLYPTKQDSHLWTLDSIGKSYRPNFYLQESICSYYQRGQYSVCRQAWWLQCPLFRCRCFDGYQRHTWCSWQIGRESYWTHCMLLCPITTFLQQHRLECFCVNCFSFETKMIRSMIMFSPFLRIKACDMLNVGHWKRELSKSSRTSSVPGLGGICCTVFFSGPNLLFW